LDRNEAKQRGLSKRSKYLLAGFLTLLLLICAALTAGDRAGLTMVERGLRDVITPIRRGALVVSEKIRFIPGFFTGFEQLMEENSRLKNEVARLQNEVGYLEEAGLENVRLRRVLDMKETIADWQSTVAQVIARDNLTWYSAITIEGGLNKGFARNMPVVTAEGLVGRIVAVSDNSAEVRLIIDRDSAVGAMVQVSRANGVVEGGGRSSKEQLSMIHIPYDAKINLNQVVISSGLGGNYPHGLRIGYITKVSPDQGGLMLKATVKPFVDFDRLEEVLVLTSPPQQYSDVGSSVEEPLEDDEDK
jgi:rod shape-determining protein MreC